VVYECRIDRAVRGQGRHCSGHELRQLSRSLHEREPEIHTKILATDNPPSGMGEIGVATVAPAIANAVFQITGERLPMTADRLKKTLV
jgi:hypothetical protein